MHINEAVLVAFDRLLGQNKRNRQPLDLAGE